MATDAVRPTKRDGRPYERFKAWAACHDLVLAIYRDTERWPKTELYGLTAQARRAAFSAAANLAEGSTKRGREFRRFIDIAAGSLSELAYVLHLAAELGFLDSEEHIELEVLRDHANRLTWGLYHAIGRKLRS